PESGLCHVARLEELPRRLRVEGEAALYLEGAVVITGGLRIDFRRDAIRRVEYSHPLCGGHRRGRDRYLDVVIKGAAGGRDLRKRRDPKRLVYAVIPLVDLTGEEAILETDGPHEPVAQPQLERPRVECGCRGGHRWHAILRDGVANLGTLRVRQQPHFDFIPGIPGAEALKDRGVRPLRARIVDGKTRRDRLSGPKLDLIRDRLQLVRAFGQLAGA